MSPKAAKPKKKSTPKASPKKTRRIVPPKRPKATDTPDPRASFELHEDPTAKEIVRRLREALTPSSLLLSSLSKFHKKHKEAKKHGGGHYSLSVVSDLFNGLSKLQRQQWIHSLLDELMKNKLIHAIEMTLKGPEEVATLGSPAAKKSGEK